MPVHCFVNDPTLRCSAPSHFAAHTRFANKLMKFVQDMGGSAVGALYNDSINVFIQLRQGGWGLAVEGEGWVGS